jgi:hypothetical protein
MDLRQMGIDGSNWIQLAQGPEAGLCERDNEASGFIRKQDIF